MEREHSDRNAASSNRDEPAGAGGYPTHHVVGVINTEDELERAVATLTERGFMEDEITVIAGQAAADALHARTGRTGLAHLAIRIAERLGVTNDEMDIRAHYEQALRDGHLLILVDAPTDARKERAVEILREHRAHTVNYLGRLAWEAIVPPREGP